LAGIHSNFHPRQFSALDARLALACVNYGEPPLLLIADLDRDLNEEGRARLERVLATYPGVVVFTGPDGLGRALGAEDVRVEARLPSR
jgi:ABC-type sulfate/molybdate transport systems ATPase subunit